MNTIGRLTNRAYDVGEGERKMQEGPFDNLDFGQEIEAVHWGPVHTKLTTPSFEATLTPDGRLLLRFSTVEILLDRHEVVSLTRFLDQYAEVEPLPDPDEVLFKEAQAGADS
jgi:hypothetical protein